jgi:hypothetical protein
MLHSPCPVVVFPPATEKAIMSPSRPLLSLAALAILAGSAAAAPPILKEAAKRW